jgi:hypothetical protein
VVDISGSDKEERMLQEALAASRAEAERPAVHAPPPHFEPSVRSMEERERQRNEAALQAALAASRHDAAPPPPPPAPPHAQLAQQVPTAPQRAALAAAEARAKAAAGLGSLAPTFGTLPTAPTPFGRAPGPSPALGAAAAKPAVTLVAPATTAVVMPPTRGGSSAASDAAQRRNLPPASASTGSISAPNYPPGSAEERVHNCARRLAGRAEAVDVLIASLQRVLQNPENEKYRRVNPKNPAFARTVGSTPGGVDFLIAVGYEPMHGQLVLMQRDPALLWLGKASLEAARDSDAYLGAKETLQVSKALEQSVLAYSEEEEKRRGAFARRVPPEPTEGSAGSLKLGVHLGDSSNWRRFEHDCTLEDVLNYVQSLRGCPVVRDATELRVANVTTRPPKMFDVRAQLGLTLKNLGLWPSGQVRCRVDGPDEAFDAAMMGIVRMPSEDRA